MRSRTENYMATGSKMSVRLLPIYTGGLAKTSLPEARQMIFATVRGASHPGSALGEGFGRLRRGHSLLFQQHEGKPAELLLVVA